jgi:uncharacterized repeat protein (TIGR04138 family)
MPRTQDLADIARSDGRYDPEALRLVGAGLRRAAEKSGKDRPDHPDRHLHASELVDGVLDLAAERWSMLATPLLRTWGVVRVLDIGEITFLLIRHGVFSKRDSDRLEDFDLPGTVHARIQALVETRLAGSAA